MSLWSSLLSVLFLIVTIPQLYAQEPVITEAANGPKPPPLSITSNGYYLTYLVDDTPIYVKITSITDHRTSPDDPTDPGDPTDPDEPDEPDDPTLDEEIRQKVATWAAEVNDPQGAQAIAVIYSTLKKSLVAGNLTPEQMWPLIPILTDRALAMVEASPKWAEQDSFRDKLGALLTDVRQRGLASTVPQIELVFSSIQQGLQDSADQSVALSIDTGTDLHFIIGEIISGN